MGLLEELMTEYVRVPWTVENINTPDDWARWSSKEHEDYSRGMADPDVSSETPQHYIEFRNVNKTFDRPVLKNVSFYVDAGQTIAIIGRSGVGKSVTLSHIMGFMKPDSGTIIVANTQHHKLPRGGSAKDPSQGDDGVSIRRSFRFA